MGEDDRKSANDDACGIPRREFLKGMTLAGSDVAVAHRLLNDTAVAAATLANHYAGMAKATMPLRLNINGSDYRWRIEPRTTLLDALRDTVGLSYSWRRISRSPTGDTLFGRFELVEKTAHDLDLHDVDSTETFTVVKLQRWLHPLSGIVEAPEAWIRSERVSRIRPEGARDAVREAASTANSVSSSPLVRLRCRCP